ncbi:Succinate dehydrogenase membrane anchor subunit [Granulibacter bethesdensis]|uniref:succinate dehydrogenase, hydrophobic membrane anchor protein n=1 Tax=Granulibacter bethesdensis TaxID=364410 RepID=UPI00090A6146|nr:succinate dehydrogenase, hydrophobic membrane anchor protein [Granulibacter bethesdensis]APH57908.1 Succinate dehydrogenase membrane anchor subunit [Granulibacter bethesdensis]
MAQSSPRIRVMRSHLGRARGLGSAKHGLTHWWAERMTSVALVPLTLWFIFAALHLTGHSRAEVAQWVGHPVHAVLLLSLVFATFHHVQLGLQVIIEDYVHTDSVKIASLLAARAACFLLALACAISILKLTL